MNIQQISSIYGEKLTETFLTILYDSPINELIDELLFYMPSEVISNIMASLEIESEL